MLMDNYQEVLLDSGYIYLSDEITEKSSEIICEKILYSNINKKSKIKEIVLLINSPGGSSWASCSIINMMEWSRVPINTIGLGIIASAAFEIFIAGCQRTITDTTSVLSHRYSWKKGGTYSDLIAEREHEDRMHDMMVNHYIKYTKLKTKEEVEKILLKDVDTWMSPEDCIKWGIADKIVKVDAVKFKAPSAHKNKKFK